MASFGEELRRERELRDISLKEIAEATNISMRFLEALEQNNFTVLPGGAYTRGFIRSYARHIGIDAEEAIRSFGLEVERQGQVAMKSESAARPAAPPPSRAGALVAAALVLTAALIAAVYWIASRSAQGEEGEQEVRSAALMARAKRAEGRPGHDRLPGRPPQPAEETAASPQSPSGAGPAGEEKGPGGRERLVRIRIAETTWIRLTCNGVVEFDKELWVGSERHFPCLPPMTLGAGNGGAVTASVDSGPFLVLGERGQEVSGKPLPLEGSPAKEPPSSRPEGGATTAAPARQAPPRAAETARADG